MILNFTVNMLLPDKRTLAFSLLYLFFVLPSAAQITVKPDSLLKQAREMAFSGNYRSSRELCRKVLRLTPDYSEAAILMGRVYAWDGNYDSARITLMPLLEENRSAELFLTVAQVEWWSDHDRKAMKLIDQGLEIDRDHLALMLLKARVLQDLDAPDMAIKTLEHLLSIHDNEGAARLLNQIKVNNSKNQLMAGYQVTAYHKHAFARHLLNVEYLRSTSAGKFLARMSYAEQNKLQSLQAELEGYVTLNEKSYVFLTSGISDRNLFPSYRAGAEVFHALPYEMEGSLGARSLFFSTERVILYTGQIGKYFRKNWISVRTFLQRKNGSWHGTGLLQLRQYFNHSDEYISLILTKGSIPSIQIGIEEIYRLDANLIGIDGQFRIGERYILGGILSFEREEFVKESYRHRFTAGLRIKTLF